MIVSFIIGGILTGIGAAGFTLLSGGTFLLAIAAYCFGGMIAGLVPLTVFALWHARQGAQDEWSDMVKLRRTASA